VGSITKKSSPARRRRLPMPSFGIDINFCGNLQCDLFAEPPDPYDNRGKSSSKVKPNLLRDQLSGSGDEKTFQCGCCGKSSIIKSNKAIIEDYRRLRKTFSPEFPRDSCSKDFCANHGKAQSKFAGLYHKSGKTSKGTQRWKCKECLKTFAPGTRLGRQKRSHTNREVLWMITNGVAITKICDFTELSPRDVYRKIDFIHERVVDFTAKREASFQSSVLGKGWASFCIRFPNTPPQLAQQAHPRTGGGPTPLHSACQYGLRHGSAPAVGRINRST